MTFAEPTAAPPDFELELFGRLAVSLDRIDHRLDEANRLARPPMAPVFYRIGAVVTIPAGGAINARIPSGGNSGPDQGHIWYVRSIIVGGVTRTTAAAGTADVYVSAGGKSDETSEPALLDLRDNATSLPSVAFYSNGDLPLRMSEELFVRFVGGTVGQQYVWAAQIEDVQEATLPQGWTR